MHYQNEVSSRGIRTASTYTWHSIHLCWPDSQWGFRCKYDLICAQHFGCMQHLNEQSNRCDQISTMQRRGVLPVEASQDFLTIVHHHIPILAVRFSVQSFLQPFLCLPN